jgi:hypothetical protein
MNRAVSQILEISFMLVLVYLVVVNADGFSSSVRALGSVYTASIKTLQGR